MTKEDLNNYVKSYTDFNGWLAEKRYEIFQDYYVGQTCLELGPAEGQGTVHLLSYFDRVVSVDGSQSFVDDLEKRFGSDEKFTGICSYFEDLELNEKFDTIVLAHILEHVDNPNEILAVAKRYLNDGGVIVADVPNGNSLHRQLGVKMGLLTHKTELNDADRSVGHKRVYTPDTFQREIETANFKITKFGGTFIKITSNSETQQKFSGEQLNAMVQIGLDNPEIAADIFVIAK